MAKRKRRTVIGTKEKPYKGKGAHQKAKKRAHGKKKKTRVGWWESAKTGRKRVCRRSRKC